MLVQINKEERGLKGAALTTFLSFAGRYCVLMPNSLTNNGISRKIADIEERKKLRLILEDTNIPEKMSVPLPGNRGDLSRVNLPDQLQFTSPSVTVIFDSLGTPGTPEIIQISSGYTITIEHPSGYIHAD
mgnify:CR=1 FL=1